MKVFLSHSTKDLAFVEKVAAQMATEGFEPWRCEVDIEPGDNFVAKIEEGLRNADLALLVWSPEAARSSWTREEWTSILARQVGESRIRLGIILLRDHPLPELLRTKNYIDARSDPDAAIRKVTEWLKGRQKVNRLAGSVAPVFLPDYEPLEFVGRSEHLNEMSLKLLNEPTTFLLYGEPGSGKSLLGLKFAWIAQREFDAVVFQVCGQRHVDEVSVELAQKLQVGARSLPPEEQREAAKKWLRQRRSLLVLDDVWSNDFKQLVPGPPTSVLSTSRMNELPWVSPRNAREVRGFSEQEAKALFEIFLGPDSTARHSEALLGFARRVGWLPIAIAVGADLLRTHCDPLDQAALSLKLETLKNEIHDVPGLLEQAIATQKNAERRLLNAMAVCISDGFWLPLAMDIAGLDPGEGKEARDTLLHASFLRLLDRDKQRFQLHPLMREKLRAQSLFPVFDQRHVAALEQLFKDWELRWKDCQECLLEVASALEFLRGEHVNQSVPLLDSWGFKAAFRVGEYDAAMRILKAAEDLWSERAGSREGKEGLERAYNNRAGIVRAWGRLDEAMSLMKKQEKLCLELGKKDGLVRTYINQAVILQTWGRLSEAFDLLKKSEALCLEIENKEWLSLCYGNLIAILEELGQLDQAMALSKKLEALCEESNDKHRLQISYLRQADVLCKWGRWDEGMAMLKKQEAICISLGEKVFLQSSYFKQALILKHWERFEEAIELFRKQETVCLGMSLKKDLAFCYWQLGQVASLQGKQKIAREKLSAALQIFSELRFDNQVRAVRANMRMGRLLGFVLRVQSRLSR